MNDIEWVYDPMVPTSIEQLYLTCNVAIVKPKQHTNTGSLTYPRFDYVGKITKIKKKGGVHYVCVDDQEFEHNICNVRKAYRANNRIK